MGKFVFYLRFSALREAMASSAGLRERGAGADFEAGFGADLGGTTFVVCAFFFLFWGATFFFAAFEEAGRLATAFLLDLVLFFFRALFRMPSSE